MYGNASTGGGDCWYNFLDLQASALARHREAILGDTRAVRTLKDYVAFVIVDPEVCVIYTGRQIHSAWVSLPCWW